MLMRSALSPTLRRRLFARLIDRNVLAMRQGRAAIGNNQRVEFDEAVALLFVVAGDLGASGQFIAAPSGAEKLHAAAYMNPRPENGVIDQHPVQDPLDQAGMPEPFGQIDR